MGRTKDHPSWLKQAMADGGVPISEDSRREVGRLRSEGTRNAIDAGLAGLTSGVGAVGAVLPYGRGNKLFRTWSAGVGAASAEGARRHMAERRAAIDDADRIERGQAEPGKEDRKRGGAVKKKAR